MSVLFRQRQQGPEEAYLVVDQSCQREIVEQIRKALPDIRIPIFPQTFIVKPVNLSDLPGFVISSQDGYSVTISEFEGDEQGDSLDGVVASIDVIAHEEVVCVGGITAYAEELGQVMLSGN